MSGTQLNVTDPDQPNGRFDGKVVFITGVARGQGREHALRFAAEGVSVIGLALCEQMDQVQYPMATPEDLAETVKLVEAKGGQIVAKPADVRSLDGVQRVVDEGLDRFGRLDYIIANAGIYAPMGALQMSEEHWDQLIDTNLGGVWRTVRAAAPAMVDRGEGGAIVVISSIAGIKGFFGSSAYSASKHGVVGFAKSLALELAPNHIRVNSIHPTSVYTPMIANDAFRQMVRFDVENPSDEHSGDFLRSQQALDTPWVEASDISDAVLFLCSEEARWITGASLPVDAGALLK